MPKRRITRKKKEKRNIPRGVAHIQSTFNNTIVTITDLDGNVVSWSSAGYPRVQGIEKVDTLCSPARR